MKKLIIPKIVFKKNFTCPKQYNNPIDPPNLDPRTCDNKK